MHLAEKKGLVSTHGRKWSCKVAGPNQALQLNISVFGKTYETPASKYRCRQRTIRMDASAQLALCRQRPSHRCLLSLSEGADPLSGPICMGVRSPTENDRRSDSVCS